MKRDRIGDAIPQMVSKPLKDYQTKETSVAPLGSTPSMTIESDTQQDDLPQTQFTQPEVTAPLPEPTRRSTRLTPHRIEDRADDLTTEYADIVDELMQEASPRHPRHPHSNRAVDFMNSQC
ncbi:hypothetical protein A0J61_09666 [Choanephora cucurbitarum]|uniref:Uncharacterized protein n=1 Tax=Choanephora cucurbitarum TaxID=101091 RepID=A0A1C7N0V1_9FUNG|nr:hypothetical protein A0J61_09666 [Choanephora cucurbitarum]